MEFEYGVHELRFDPHLRVSQVLGRRIQWPNKYPQATSIRWVAQTQPHSKAQLTQGGGTEEAIDEAVDALPKLCLPEYVWVRQQNCCAHRVP